MGSGDWVVVFKDGIIFDVFVGGVVLVLLQFVFFGEVLKEFILSDVFGVDGVVVLKLVFVVVIFGLIDGGYDQNDFSLLGDFDIVGDVFVSFDDGGVLGGGDGGDFGDDLDLQMDMEDFVFGDVFYGVGFGVGVIFGGEGQNLELQYD